MFLVEYPNLEFYNEETQRFVYTEGASFQIEHSLISLSKWESKWHKPFLDNKEKTREELLDYIRCMTLTKNVAPSTYQNIPDYVLRDINSYIEDPMTATWFSKDTRKNKLRSHEVITAEIIYYWMVSYNIPFECQKWHLNRLLTLIRVCSIKNAPDKKMSRKDIFRNNARLNAARRKALNSRG